MNEAQEKLKAAVAEHGGARAAAKALGVSHEVVYGSMAGRIPFGRKLSVALGIPVPDTSPSERRRQAVKAKCLEALELFDRPVSTGHISVRVGCLDRTAAMLLKELAQERKAKRIGYKWLAVKAKVKA